MPPGGKGFLLFALHHGHQWFAVLSIDINCHFSFAGLDLYLPMEILYELVDMPSLIQITTVLKQFYKIKEYYWMTYKRRLHNMKIRFFKWLTNNLKKTLYKVDSCQEIIKMLVN